MTRPVTVKKSDMTRTEDAAIRLAQKAQKAGLQHFTAEVTQDGVARIILSEAKPGNPDGPEPW